MNPLLDEDDDDLKREERELTLSTGMLLGIFLALVVLCGAFFGFGYKMGSHNKTGPAIATTGPDTPPATGDTFNGFKPAAGSPAGSSESGSTPTAGPSDASDGSAAAGPTATPSSATGTAPVTPAPAAAAPEAAAAAGSYVVQVAAVSHEEDAQLLVSALKAKGYPVSAHTEPQDKFFHIQVGPFTNMKDANAAKQRLVADGYQPIIK